MISNLERYKKDLERLIHFGDLLENAIKYECFPSEYGQQLKDILKDKYDYYIKKIPAFNEKYQDWYSESLVIIKLLLPLRLNDFIKLYEIPKNRKELNNGNYVIEDYLQGITVSRGLQNIVGTEAAIPRFQQQLNILRSVQKRFESSLFDIKQLIQADLLDSELEAAKELNKKGFVRGAGAIAGVVLEKHLCQVCENHNVKIVKKNPSISDLNDKLKESQVYETPIWRHIQLLGDLRNLCDHNKKVEPKTENIVELIEGVDKITKTIF